MNDAPTGGVNRSCEACGIVVYDIPVSDGNGTGYRNADYCPMCGDPIHEDWDRCDECGEVIDHKKATSYYKTKNDERFWHNECAPNIRCVHTSSDELEDTTDD